MRTQTALATLLLTLTLASGAHTDEVLFGNGDRWTGRLISLVGGRLKFETDLVGGLEVPIDVVRSFRTDEPVEIHSRDGRVSISRVTPGEAGELQLTGPEASDRRVLDIRELRSINPPAPEEPHWEGSLLSGFQFERGNTIQDEAYVKIELTHLTERSRLTLSSRYDGERTTSRSTGQGTTNDRNLLARVGYDRYLGGKWLWWLGASAEKDGPAELDLRFTGGGGAGYRFYDRKDLELRGRLGPVWIHEDFADDTSDNDRLGGLLQWEFRKALSPTWSLFQNATFTQSFEDIDESLLQAEVGLRADITRHVFFESKIVYEWDSEPAARVERQDVDYILGIGYRFD